MVYLRTLMVYLRLIVCVFLCKYLLTYLFLTHIPTHTCKLNLYLPLPIPFQMFL